MSTKTRYRLNKYHPDTGLWSIHWEYHNLAVAEQDEHILLGRGFDTRIYTYDVVTTTTPLQLVRASYAKTYKGTQGPVQG